MKKEVAVRIILVSIVIGPLMLFGALPAVAGQSISSDTRIQLAAGGDSTADRDTYTQKALERIDHVVWPTRHRIAGSRCGGIRKSGPLEAERVHWRWRLGC